MDSHTSTTHHNTTHHVINYDKNYIIIYGPNIFLLKLENVVDEVINNQGKSNFFFLRNHPHRKREVIRVILVPL